MQDYLACVASIDENIGRLLDYLDKNDLTENTLSCIPATRECIWEKMAGLIKDGCMMYPCSAPLLMSWPGHIKPNTVNTNMVQTIDYAPTILDAAGIPVPSFMQGLSLVPTITGKQKIIQQA